MNLTTKCLLFGPEAGNTCALLSFKPYKRFDKLSVSHQNKLRYYLLLGVKLYFVENLLQRAYDVDFLCERNMFGMFCSSTVMGWTLTSRATAFYVSLKKSDLSIDAEEAVTFPANPDNINAFAAISQRLNNSIAPLWFSQTLDKDLAKLAKATRRMKSSFFDDFKTISKSIFVLHFAALLFCNDWLSNAKLFCICCWWSKPTYLFYLRRGNVYYSFRGVIACLGGVAVYTLRTTFLILPSRTVPESTITHIRRF